MSDQDRTVKFTFTAEDNDLKQSFKDAAKEVDKLKSKLSDLSKDTTSYQNSLRAADSKKTDSSVAVDAANEVLQANKELLDVYRKQGTILASNLSRTKQLTAAGGGGGVHDQALAQSGGGKGGGFGAVGSFVKRIGIKAIAAAAGAAGAAVSAQLRQGYGAYFDYASGLASLSGTGATYSGMNRARHEAVQYGYNATETTQQSLAAALATGQASSVNTAQMFSRATSLDVGQTTGFMGSLTQAGHGFGGLGGATGKREFQNVISLGFKSGIDEARLPEYLQGVDKVMTAQGGRLGGDVSATNVARILQAMGGTGHAGLQGARGAAVLSKIDRGITNPGGGEAGQAIMLQAMGFGKPGGDTTYYEALKRQQRGATPDNVRAVFSEFGSQFGADKEMNLGLSNAWNMDLDVVEKLQDAFATMSGDARDEEVKKILEGSKSADERAADNMEELGKVMRESVQLQNRLVNIGEPIYPAIHSLQLSINRVLDQAFPLATEATKAIAWTAEQGTGGFSNRYMGAEGNRTVRGSDHATRRGYTNAERWGAPAAPAPYTGGLPQVSHSGAAKDYSPSQRRALTAYLTKSGNEEKYAEFSAALRTPKLTDDREILTAILDELKKTAKATTKTAGKADTPAPDASGKPAKPAPRGE